jgi:hypothetical protein
MRRVIIARRPAVGAARRRAIDEATEQLRLMMLTALEAPAAERSVALAAAEAAREQLRKARRPQRLIEKIRKRVEAERNGHD